MSWFRSRDEELVEAVDRRDVRRIRKLLSAGANPNATYKNGNTVLHMATVRGHGDIVRSLLLGGADPNAGAVNDSATPLILASASGKRDIVQLLIDSGGDVNRRTTSDLVFVAAEAQIAVQAKIEMWKFRPAMGHLVGDGTGGGSTALMFASAEGDAEIVKALLKAGARVNDENASGKNALSVARAALVRRSTTHEEIVRLLMQAGAMA